MNKMKELGLLVGGRHRAASNSRSFERINPVTGEPASRVAAATLEDADAAVAAARAAFPTWSALAPTVHDEAQMPFGGVKESGYGRFGGKAAIAEFTDLRWITIQTGARHYPI